MRGKKVKRLRRIALRAYPPSEATSGYPFNSETWYGPQWRRFHRYLKRG